MAGSRVQGWLKGTVDCSGSSAAATEPTSQPTSRGGGGGGGEGAGGTAWKWRMREEQLVGTPRRRLPGQMPAHRTPCGVCMRMREGKARGWGGADALVGAGPAGASAVAAARACCSDLPLLLRDPCPLPCLWAGQGLATQRKATLPPTARPTLISKVVSVAQGSDSSARHRSAMSSRLILPCAPPQQQLGPSTRQRVSAAPASIMLQGGWLAGRRNKMRQRD